MDTIARDKNEAAPDCVSETTLVSFFAGGLSVDRVMALEQHLDRCADCAALVEVAAPMLAGASGRALGWGLPAEAEPGKLIADRYRVESVIGCGASGYVLRARDELLGTAVAVKLLRPERAAEPVMLQHLHRELRVARALNHPHVCRVYDLQTSGESRFLVMELGRCSLRDELRAPPRVERTLDQRLDDADAITAGLGAIHAAGILHRDVKPENLLRMDDGRLVVSDFGLASLAPQGSATRFVGTPLYMAPEVASGEQATRASDVFSLGVVLHELFFGARPRWRSSSGRRVLETPDGARTRRERALARLCGECLSVAPEERPAEARTVLLRLRAARAGGGFLPWRRPPHWPAVPALVMISLLALLGGVTFMLLPSTARRATLLSAPTPLPALEPRLFLSDAWRVSFSGGGRAVLNRRPMGAGFELVDLQKGTRTMLSDTGKDATLSPDERWVAYVTEPNPNSPTEEKLFLLELATGERRELGPGGSPAFSRDGTLLIFHERERSEMLAYDLRALEGTPKASLFYEEPLSFYPAIAPDGKRIAFGTREGIVVVDRESRKVLATWPVPGRRGLLLGWSPDGRLLAFGGFRDDRLGVWVLHPAARRVMRVSAENSSRPTFTPDGESLVFDTALAVPPSIYRLPMTDVVRHLAAGMTEREFLLQLRPSRPPTTRPRAIPAGQPILE